MRSLGERQPAGTGVTVQLHLHAASTQTSYLGLMKTPFVDGVKDREINLTVPRGSQPVSSLVSGRLVDSPGPYSLSIALDATQEGVEAPIRITQQVPVVVTKLTNVQRATRAGCYSARCHVLGAMCSCQVHVQMPGTWPVARGTWHVEHVARRARGT